MHRTRALFFSAIFLCTAAVAIGQINPAASGSLGQQVRDCSRNLFFNFEDIRRSGVVREIPIWQMPGNAAFFFDTGMNIDADGAPNAYNAANTGLDDLSNAGEPGNWGGVIQDDNGNPYVQGPNDPFPGFFVSCTALSDRTKSRIDPTRYVDASKIPYIVLPGGMARQAGARLGDFAIVFNLRSGKSSYAIFADIGTMGEGSVALARNLGIDSDARSGGAARGIRFVVFPGSGNGQPRSLEEINAEGARLFQAWSGSTQLGSCPVNRPAGPSPNQPAALDANENR
jgi:hypothetical protein